MSFDAFFPADLARTALHERALPDGAVLRYPVLAAPDVLTTCHRLRAVTEQLRSRPVREIVRAIDAAAALLRSGDLHDQALEWIPRTTGYSPAMAAQVVQRMSEDWSEEALWSLLHAELGSPETLDGFVVDAHTQRNVTAIGPTLSAHIFSGNVPGVAVTSLVRALLVKSPSFGKTAAEEPILPVLFARALQQVDPALAEAVAIAYWPGGTVEVEETLFREAEAIVVYGGEQTVESVRRFVGTAHKLIVHGPRFSLGLVGAKAGQSTARDVARAVALFDQQGCVSPHVVYVISDDGRAALTFARRVADELEAVSAELPRGQLSTEEVLQVREVRAQAEFGAIAGKGIELFAARDLSHTVIFDADPTFQPSCLNRVLYVKPIAQANDVIGLVAPFRQFLQSVAIAGLDENETADLALQLGRIGASRITSFAALPWPSPAWHHDGNGPLRELLRWVDLEG
jgi:hypothetical protein